MIDGRQMIDELHPTGRCTCAGGGICPWCIEPCPDCGEGRNAGCECQPPEEEDDATTDPQPALFVLPTIEEAQRFSDEHFAPVKGTR